MDKRTIITCILTAVALGLTALGWFVLPDECVVQVGVHGQATKVIPKMSVVLLSLVLSGTGVGFAFRDERYKGKGLLLSGMAVFGMIMTFIFNR